MAKIGLSITLPAVPDEFEDLDEVKEYLNDLITAIYDPLDSLLSEFNGKIEVINMMIKDADPITFGEEINGSWRIVRDGNDLSFQRREAGIWVEKGAFTA